MKPDRDTRGQHRLDPTTYGFVGLGAMGMPIALRLASVVDHIAVSDNSPERVSSVLRTAGHAAVEDPEILNKAETVFLCLPSQSATQSVVATLLQEPKIYRTFIDFGAHPPDFVAELSETCKSASAQYCDCPVFGTPLMAERGELYFLFSGPQQVSDLFQELAAKCGYRMRYSGPSGTASLVKLLQNAIGTANLAIGAEALRICEATEVDPGLFIDVVRECGGIGQSSVFDRFADDMAARRDSGEGRLRIAAKDMKSIASVVAASEISAPLLTETTRQFDRAMQAGLGEHQFTDIINLHEEEISES